MKNILLTLIAVFFYPISFAQVFDYDSSTRRILVKGPDSSSSIITINSNNNYWEYKNEILTDGGTFNGALQISDLGQNEICSRSYAWNKITGSYPAAPDSQNSIISSFTLASETKLKIDFMGMGHFTNQGNYLFFEPAFFLKSGFSGSGGTVLQFNGSGIDYVTVPAGNYRISTAIGTFHNCSNDPNCGLSFASQSRLSITSVDLLSNVGEAFSNPFTPDTINETQNPDFNAVNEDGAFIIRGEDSIYSYADKPNGWFDMGKENRVEIEMQSTNIITEVQLPDNRQGTFKLMAGAIEIGEFIANDIIVLADYSTELGASLLTGAGGLQGVASLDILYQPALGENINNNCGETKSMSIKLSFDENLVTFDAVMPYILNFIFKGDFEG